MLEAVVAGFVVLSVGVVLHVAVMRVSVGLLHVELRRYSGRGMRAMHILLMATLMMLVAAAAQVSLWAGLFLERGWLNELEPAFYFAAATFTTLGYGDVVLPPPHRIATGICAMNGLITFSLIAALMVDLLHQLRRPGFDASI